MQKTIFVVDDQDTYLSIAKEALKDHYQVMTMPSAEKMFSLIEKITPDLILLDIDMPVMDGFEALCRLKTNALFVDIPVVFLTGMTDTSVEVSGFQLGVVDFIAKPFSAPVLLNRVKTHLDIDDMIRERTKQLQDKTEQLEDKTRQLERMQNGLVFILADMVESRDLRTGGHVERTSAYLEILVRAMIDNNVYADELSEIDLDLFVSSARLHDVGKIAISDNILNKPGRLTGDEFSTMKTHTTQGERIIDQVVSRTGEAAFLLYAKLTTGCHHERWDGTGYPYGLEGKEIPIQGRIMSIVDVYDALISERPYKEAFSHEEAVKIIMESSGKQFDPLIANTFFEVRELIKKVKQDFEINE